MELWSKIDLLHHLILYLNAGMALNGLMIWESDDGERLQVFSIGIGFCNVMFSDKMF